MVIRSSLVIMSFNVSSAIILTIVENNSKVCKCGHTREKHAPENERVETVPCYECLGLYIKDRVGSISLENAHKICENFKLDNLRYLEQEYERLSKRIRRLSH